MLIVCLRTVIMFGCIVLAMRLMGKRQIGELQPSELVTTIIISNLASLPIEETDISLMLGIVPIALIVSIEVLVSLLELKSSKFSKFVAGESKVLIRDGKLEQKTMKDLRFNITDVLGALRAKEVFDLDEVEFALVETNGQVSIFKKTQQGEKPQVPVIVDGELVPSAMEYCQTDANKVSSWLEDNGVQISQVLLMTQNNKGERRLVRKEQ